VCLYLPEISHGGGQRALSGDVSRVPGIVVHLRGEERKEKRGRGDDEEVNNTNQRPQKGKALEIKVKF